MGGLFGVASRESCVLPLFYGTDYHCHLGTRRGGLAVRDGRAFTRSIHDISSAQFKSKFEDDVARMSGGLGIGVISDYEDQPLIIGSHLGVFAIATVGVVKNAEVLAREAFRTRSAHFSEMSGNEINPTELVATLISRADSFEAGIGEVQERIEGSCSLLLLLTGRGIYAARDRWGRTPLFVGKGPAGYAVAMETCAFPNTGYETVHALGPGEVVLVTPEGFERRVAPREEMQICSFLWVYYGYPASSYEGVNVEQFRYRNGSSLAEQDSITVDSVAGIPDSGTAHALGYSHRAGIPFTRPFVKYTPTWARSFMPQEQSVRATVARMKLIPVRELTAGKRLLFCDDSIVRGTQLADLFRRLYEYGAREIHLRISCPPLLYGCRFLNFSRSRTDMDLAARRAVQELEGGEGDSVPPCYLDSASGEFASMVERIRASLGLTSLRYQTLTEMVRAIGLSQERLCTYCWNGCSPQ